MSEEKPNIVLVVMDTARAQNFSCYGYERETSPFLDSLAEENIKYENAFSQANWTLGSHGSIFSGKYLSEHGISSTKSYDSFRSFTDVLSERGYTTFGISNIGYVTSEYDADCLFDRFHYNRGEGFFDGLDVKRENFDPRDLRSYKSVLGSIVKKRRFDKVYDVIGKGLGKVSLRSDSGAESTNEKAKDYLKDLDDEPFFMFLNYAEPHTPYLPPFPFSHEFLDSKMTWKSLIGAAEIDLGKFNSSDLELEDDVLERLEALYDGELKYLDRKLEDIYNWISQKYPNTIFVFTSDHGELFNEHGLMTHSISLFEEVTHVPLVEVRPDGNSSSVSSPVELRGLHDHILDLSRGEESLMREEIVFSEDIGFGGDISQTNYNDEWGYYGVSAITQDFKFVWYDSGKVQLFSLPKESEVENEEKAIELRKEIEDKFGSPEENSYRRDSIDPESERIKQDLKELGYF